MNTKLKKAAMKKAREEGWTISAMLNLATRAYVDNRFQPIMLDHGIIRGLDDIKHGRVFSQDIIGQELQERIRKEKSR